MHKQVEVDRLASLKAAHVSNGNNVIAHNFRRIFAPQGDLALVA